MSVPFDAGTSQEAVRLAIYLYYPDGSSAVAEGENLRVDAEMDFGGRMVDVQAVPELEMRLTPVMCLRIHPPSMTRSILRVTKRPPITQE